jgi:hypothetical protein
MHHTVVNLTHLFQMKLHVDVKPISGSASRGHAPRQQFDRMRVYGQCVRLPVVSELQPVLQLS